MGGSKRCQWLRDEFSLRMFCMNHEDPAVFVTFQCGRPLWYIPWTIFWFLFFASMLILEAVYNDEMGARGPRYLTFITNTSFIFQGVAVTLDMLVTVYVNVRRKDLVQRKDNPDVNERRDSDDDIITNSSNVNKNISDDDNGSYSSDFNSDDDNIQDSTNGDMNILRDDDDRNDNTDVSSDDGNRRDSAMNISDNYNGNHSADVSESRSDTIRNQNNDDNTNNTSRNDSASRNGSAGRKIGRDDNDRSCGTTCYGCCHNLCEPTPRYIQVTWVMFNIVNSASLLVSFGFYALSSVVDLNLRFSKWSHSSINRHILNSVYTLLALAFSAKPVRLLHAYQPMIYATGYLLLTLFYDIDGHRPVYGREGPLDWEGRTARTASLAVVMICLVAPLIHVVTFAAYKLRVFVYRRWLRRSKVHPSDRARQRPGVDSLANRNSSSTDTMQ